VCGRDKRSAISSQSLRQCLLCRGADVGVLESGSSGYYYLTLNKDRQCTYNLILRCVRVTIVAVKNQ
jgi:hypothetical protein